MGRCVLCSLLLLTAQPAFGQKALTWKWKQDDTFYVNTSSRVRQTLTIEGAGGKDQGREVSQEFGHTTRLRYTVRKVDAAGNAEIVQRVERVLIRCKLPLEKDQATERDDDSLKGAELVLHVTPRGEVTKVEGVEKLLAKLGGGDVGKRKRAVLAEALSAESLKKQASQAFGFLPAEPLKKGLHWTRPAGVAFGPLGRLDAERVYVYDGSLKDKGPVKIAFTTEVKGFTPGKPGPAGLLVTSGKFKPAKGKGSLEFDAARGRLIKADSGLKLEGDITFKDPDSETEYRGHLTQEQAIQTTVSDKPK